MRVTENDELPKSICELCVQQLHQISEYRQKCSNTQTMLRGCLGTTKLKNEGRVSSSESSVFALSVAPRLYNPPVAGLHQGRVGQGRPWRQ